MYRPRGDALTPRRPGPGPVQRAQAGCALTSDSGSAALTLQAPASVVLASISSVSRPKRLASAWPSSRLSLPSPPFGRNPPGDPQTPAPRALTQDGPLDAGEEHPPAPSTGSPPPRPPAELLGPQSPNSRFLTRSPGDPPAAEHWPARHGTPGLLETRGLGSLRQQQTHSPRTDAEKTSRSPAARQG